MHPLIELYSILWFGRYAYKYADDTKWAIYAMRLTMHNVMIDYMSNFGAKLPLILVPNCRFLASDSTLFKMTD